MKREELIAYDKWLTRRKWGTGEIISPEKAADLYLAEHPLPPAEGAEENIIYHNLTQPFRQILQSVALHGYDIVFAERDCVKCATEFATLHAQKIADKMKEANQFILDIAKTIGIETDGVGFDGLTLNIDDFKEAADKMVSERLIEFGNMIRDEPNGDIPALAEYFMRTINLKSSER